MAHIAEKGRFALITPAEATAKAIADATEAGYRPLTIAYFPNEIWMMNNLERDLQRGRIPYLLIEVGPGQTEVWRHGGIEAPNQTRSVAKGIRGGME